MWVAPLKIIMPKMVPLRGGTPITVCVGGFPFIFVHFRKNEINL